MKMKSLAVLAATGLLAASFAYVVPAYADDEPFDLAMNDQPATGVENGAARQDVAGNNNAAMADAGNAAQNAAPANPVANNGMSNQDQGQPDVASGDDDY